MLISALRSAGRARVKPWLNAAAVPWKSFCSVEPGGVAPPAATTLPSIFRKHKDYLVVDIETQQLVDDVGGWSNVDKLTVSVACAYDSRANEFLSYSEEQMPSLVTLCSERLVIGFNFRAFDAIVLKRYGFDLRAQDVFDIKNDVEAACKQRYLSLNQLARGTLGEAKSGDGLVAVSLWKQGRINELTEYCRRDVELTRDVFVHGMTKGFVLVQNSASLKRVNVQWT